MDTYNVTLNQLAYGIFEVVRGQISDDDDIAIKQIKDMIHSTRAKLLKQKFDKNPRVIDDVFTQPLGALEIEAVDSSLHSTILAGRHLYRTVRELPETIDRKNYEGTYVRIGPADILAPPYHLVSHDRALYSGRGKSNKDQIFCFLRDRKMHLISYSGAYHKAVQFIDIQGVFQNPAQVAIFLNTSGSALTFGDKSYPISRSMKDDIEKIIIREKLGPQAGAPSDPTNDGTHNLNAN
jgi:hypothetical protein